MIIIYNTEKKVFSAYSDAKTAAEKTGFPVAILRGTRETVYGIDEFLIGQCKLVKGRRGGYREGNEENFAVNKTDDHNIQLVTHKKDISNRQSDMIYEDDEFVSTFMRELASKNPKVRDIYISSVCNLAGVDIKEVDYNNRCISKIYYNEIKEKCEELNNV